MPAECIDSHHHLWQYTEADYPWMSDKMDILRRDYMLQDLAAVTQAAGVTGTVAVQARQSERETAWLLELAGKSDLIRGVVGWAPLIDRNVAAYLERVAADPKLKGMRHVLHDEADDLYMLRDDFNAGVAWLRRFGLRYDILIFEKHLPQTLHFIDRHPSQIFIVDHIAKPKIASQEMEPWRERMKEIARRPNVYCKLSGMVTEARWDAWTESDLRPYTDAVLEAFGAKRVMFGSDWPVLGLAASYTRWADVVRDAIRDLSADEQQNILAGTAREAYGL